MACSWIVSVYFSSVLLIILKARSMNGAGEKANTKKIRELNYIANKKNSHLIQWAPL